MCDKPNVPLNRDEIANIKAEHEDTPESFTINHTDYESVNKILHSLRNDCSSGFDQIPPNLVKPVIDHITSPLMHIINNSIDKQIFPDQWKVARVCPIPKTKHPTQPKDFRPVSILPLFSKVYEKVILYQLLPYIEQKIYNETQSGFRKGHSTATLLMKFRDDIKRAMNANEITLAVLIDYSKAFDTIDHTILLKKLIHFGFDTKSVTLLMNYLSNRTQYVQVEDKISKTLPIYFGVPQGSILGPILFNIYVSKLPDQIVSNSIQYADDTTISRSCKINSILQNIKLIENDVKSLSNWSKQNGLLFNNTKLQFIIFWKRRTTFPTDRSFLIKTNGKSIKQEDDVKLLGITLDHNLEWNTQINNLTKSLYGTLQTLKRFKRFTPYATRKTLAESLVLSKLNYCQAVYSDIPKYLLNRLQRVQTCTAGYVIQEYARYNDIIHLKWLPIEESMQYNLAKYAFKALRTAEWPSYLPLTTLERRRNLRSSSDGLRVENGDPGTFQHQSGYVFNSLPKKIRECEIEFEFNKLARRHYFDQAMAKSMSWYE